jgi:hypothetical protein
MAQTRSRASISFAGKRNFYEIIGRIRPYSAVTIQEFVIGCRIIPVSLSPAVA